MLSRIKSRGFMDRDSIDPEMLTQNGILARLIKAQHWNSREGA